jgi:hypothetical protein
MTVFAYSATAGARRGGQVRAHRAPRQPAGCPILVGVGAPTSLAVELADDRGMTLCGFARRGRVNLYTHSERVEEPG